MDAQPPIEGDENYVWRVESSAYDDLANALNRLSAEGYEIFEVVPHRDGREVRAECIARKPESEPRPTEWLVRGVEYGQLEARLNEFQHAGWKIFSVVPHRQGRDVLAEVIASRPCG